MCIKIEIVSISTTFWYLIGRNLVMNCQTSQIAWKLHFNCVILCEIVYETVWKYHCWIFQLEYMFLDTQWVEIRPEMAEIAKLFENGLKIAFNCMKGLNEYIRLCESISNEFFSSSTYFFITNICVKNCIKIGFLLHESVWMST